VRETEERRVVAGEEEDTQVTQHSHKKSGPMCCYVGKATKIFLCLVTALLLAGLVLGFGLAHRTLWGARKAEPACRWPRCNQQQPLYGGPLLPATATSTPPLTEPAVAVFPGGVAASSAAVPPATASVPVFGPPSPFSVAVGPGPSSRP
jgi:phosphotransferase system  glucose/maltose/N-acetylglucosamine-specific IIC component